MRKYWHIASMHWQLRMVYRLNAMLEASGNLITMLATLALWLFAFQKTGHANFGGYSQEQMIVYILFAGIITSAFWHTSSGDAVIDVIRTGRFSKYLVKPLNLSANHFIAEMIGTLFRFAFSAAAAVILLIVFDAPANLSFHWSQFLIFLVFFILAIGIRFLIFYCAALLAFWMDEVWGVTFLIRVFADVAAGAFVPLALFAPFWQNIFNILPFKYIISIPVNALLGRLTPQEIMPTALTAIGWLLGLSLLTWFTWKRGVRHYSAVGD